MKNNESMEMYLETVYRLENSHGHAHVGEIAERLDVSKPSVTKAMRQLNEQGLIDREKYGTITLTPKGVEISEAVYRRHVMLEHFLMHALELSTKQAAENACRIEHFIDEDMVCAIEKYLIANQIPFPIHKEEK